MGEPMQTFLVVASTGTAITFGLAGAFVTATAAGITMEAVTAMLALTMNTVIWPATLIVGSLALLAAGMVYLEEKTGILSAAWKVAKDLFTIFAYTVSDIAGRLRDWVGQKIEDIKGFFMEFIPAGALDSIENFYNAITGWFGDAANEIDKSATLIEEKNAKAAESFQLYGNIDMSGTRGEISTVDDLVNTLGVDTVTNTGLLENMGNVPMGGTLSQIGAVDTAMVGAGATGNELFYIISNAGNVRMDGTNSQISLVDSNGKATSLTIAQLQTYIQNAGNQSMAGTQGQLALVDSKGKATNITTQQAIALLQNAGNQSMAGTISGINGIFAAWDKAAAAAANAVAKEAMARRSAEKIIGESYSSSGGNGSTGGDGTGEGNVRIINNVKA